MKLSTPVLELIANFAASAPPLMRVGQRRPASSASVAVTVVTAVVFSATESRRRPAAVAT